MNEGTAADVTAAHGGRSRQSKKHSKTYRSISAILSWLTARRPTTLSTSLRARFLSYLLTIAIAWLPWLILTWPGSMRDDTLAQYLQSSGLHHYYTQHPLFDTLTFGLFWHIGSALGSHLIGQAPYTVTQAVLLAAGCALLLCYIRKIGSPRWLIGLGLVYLATNYVVVGAITTMGKDSLHAVFYLPLAVLFVEACLTCGSVLGSPPGGIRVRHPAVRHHRLQADGAHNRAMRRLLFARRLHAQRRAASCVRVSCGCHRCGAGRVDAIKRGRHACESIART